MESSSVGADGAVRLDELGRVRGWSSVAELAADYWRYQRLSGQAKERDDMAAWFCVTDLVSEPAWAGVLELLEVLLREAEDFEVGLLAAGPLDDLVSSRDEGARFVVGIEERARRDERWAQMVRGVWLDRSADPDVNRRLAVFGTRYPDGTTPI